jgi:hypothetical protein
MELFFFTGVLSDTRRFGIILSFTSSHNNAQLTLVTFYGPCHGMESDNFVSWLYNLQIPIDSNWLLIGDFNFIRSQDNRNIPGGDVNDMFLFNEIIEHLGLLELQLKGRKFTYSHKQNTPLLEQLDWFFTSSNWISVYPNTMVFPAAHSGSDMLLVWCLLTQIFPKQRYFGLGIIGSKCQVFWIV